MKLHTARIAWSVLVGTGIIVVLLYMRYSALVGNEVLHLASAQFSQTASRSYFDSVPLALPVPILMYHYIRSCDDPEDKNCSALSVRPETFSVQLQWLRAHGYVSVDFDYFVRPYYVKGKPMIITFDDGYEDAFSAALPILERHAFTATFYVISGRVGSSGYLTWSQIEQMRQKGMSIASHTQNHLDLTSLHPNDFVRELQSSKEQIETRVGTVSAVSYPFGAYNAHVQQAVRQAGYLSATTTKEGVANFNSDHFALPRVRMKEQTVLEKALDSSVQS